MKVKTDSERQIKMQISSVQTTPGNEEAVKVCFLWRTESEEQVGEIRETDEHSALFEHISLL